MICFLALTYSEKIDKSDIFTYSGVIFVRNARKICSDAILPVGMLHHI
ncbi:hypothetical protein AGMMS50249_6510 [candidate division SR1 bacterium]|nr:hypothetical protein AGMMS50249_6510 [candidate division SR1 bacterium]